MSTSRRIHRTALGRNILFSIRGDLLTFTIDLSKDFGPSKKTGRTRVIASSGTPKYITEDIIATINVGRVIEEEQSD